MRLRSACLGRLLTATLLELPGIAAAQSEISGVVTDETEAVLPGAVVNASRPAVLNQCDAGHEVA